MAHPKIERVYSEPAHDPDSRYGTEHDQAMGEDKQHPLDSEESLERLKKIENWWAQTQEAHVENRYQQATDEEFYDNNQWTEEDKQALAERNQAALVFNLIGPAVDWAIGTERRTRMDFRVLPRQEDDVEGAAGKTKLLKYINDVSRAEMERSLAFEDQVKVGVGWLEEGVRSDRTEEPVFVRQESWRNMWWDAQSRRNDLEDCRYIFRRKWLDLDVAVMLFPEREHALRGAAVEMIYPDEENYYDETSLPSVYQYRDKWGRVTNAREIAGSLFAPNHARKRVPVVECWYKEPTRKKKIWGDKFYNEILDPENREMVAEAEHATLTDVMTMEIRCATFIPGVLLQDVECPYRHGEFPFTPFWYFRRGRDGMPYGMIRRMRDPQEDYNKRYSKALHALSTNQIVAEDDAKSDQMEWHDIHQQAAMPNGQILLRPGRKDAFEIVRQDQLADAHLKLLDVNKEHIRDTSGVSGENLAQETNAQSGKAIIAKQREGSLVTAKLFDNYHYGFQNSGQKELSLIEQFMVEPFQVRIVGDRGQVRFEKFNQPVWNPELNDWVFRNDITATQADFKVSEQDFHESVRIAASEKLFELIGKLDPQTGLQLLDLAVELVDDIPGKEEIVKRIRQINGHMDPEEADSPEAQQQAMAVQRQKERQQQIEEAKEMATIEKDRAQAEKYRADADKDSVETKGKALEVAGNLSQAPFLGPVADTITEDGGNA